MFLNNSASLQHMGANLKQAQQQQHPTLALNDYQQNALMVLQYLNQKHQQEQLVKQDLFRQDELNAAQLLLNFSKASSSAPQISFSNQQTKLNTPVTPSSMMNGTNSNEIKKPEEQNRKILKPHPKFRVKVSFIFILFFFQLC